MYAVIETGGKQYKVGLGDRLKVEKLAAKEGDSIDIGRVLMIAEGEKITTGKNAADQPVKAEVLGHGRRKKIKVFKKKRRKGYRRTQGHRQDYTELQIVGIGNEILEAKETVPDTRETVGEVDQEEMLSESSETKSLGDSEIANDVGEDLDEAQNPNPDSQEETTQKAE